MGLFGRRKDYDRKRLLRAAREAQRRGRHRNAITHYRRVLIVEPNNDSIHALIAPSLAECGLRFSAWESYSRSATAMLRDGKKQHALDCYCDATLRMPRHYEAWCARIAVECSMARRADAKRSLEDALPHFRRRATRHPLISLLRRRLALDLGDTATTLELAFTLAKTGQKDEAMSLLRQLAQSSNGPVLRSIRRTQWNIAPNLTHSWLWLRSCMASS
jgi:tetratricopeptide (TPR) repeat protein